MTKITTVEHVLVKYIRDKKGNPRGVIVAIGATEFGYALVAKGEVFRKKVGRTIAVGRALKHGPNVQMPLRLVHEVEIMSARAKRYFK